MDERLERGDAARKKLLLDSGKSLLEKGLVYGTGGNLSARAESGNSFWITPSGMDYRLLDADDLVEMSFEGKILTGHRRPSIEWMLHRALYVARPDVEAVVHTHSTYATTLAAARQDLMPVTDTFVVVFGECVQVADYGLTGSAELAANAVSTLGNGVAALLANHGAVCVGKDVKAAFETALLLEQSAAIYMGALALGGTPLASKTVDFLMRNVVPRYGQGEFKDLREGDDA